MLTETKAPAKSAAQRRKPKKSWEAIKLPAFLHSETNRHQSFFRLPSSSTIACISFGLNVFFFITISYKSNKSS